MERVGVFSLSDKYCLEGMECMKRRDYDEAEARFKKALTYKHDHSKTLLQYGLLLQTHRQHYEAAAELWRGGAAIALKNKHHMQMMLNLSVLLEKRLMDYDGAEKYYKLALEADPTHVNTLVNYGLFLAHIRKDMEKSEQYLKRAIRQDPTRKSINNGGYLLQEILARAPESSSAEIPADEPTRKVAEPQLGSFRAS